MCGLVASHLGRRLAADFAGALRSTELRLQVSAAQVDADRAEMASMLEHLADGVLVLGADERIDFWNPAAARLLRRARLGGRPLAEVLPDRELVEVPRPA